ALRKAKLFYMFEDKRGSVLPCYWADMILIGNTEPVTFSRGPGKWWDLAISVLVVLLGVLVFKVRILGR
ncbi:MAG TPA: hypothetical protein VIM64_06730, partial [Puia sp.]